MSESQEEMKVDPSRAQALISQLNSVKERLAAVANGRNVRLVAVSKLKPANDILALHHTPASHTHFGHCKSLGKIPNLFCVSSIDTSKKAQLLNTTRTTLLSTQPDLPKIGVHVQVNTSGEEAKSGCAPGADTVALCREIVETCPSLRLLGLMTIGAIARSKATTAETENEDFVALKGQRDLVAKELGLDEDSLELSMGMSEDFEGAVRLGSGEVRVGSTIFGERPAKADAKIKE
ncbi:hypothetical protein F66182_5964 [Fusarium sp. NRRL 66182]|nr:hypothetical protein F66182_5964 [Fusarium sp. NRRL 66182]